jgi:hypothetical protein
MSLWRANGLSRRASPTDSAHLREKQRAQTPLDLFRETQLSRYNAVSDDIGAGMRRRFSGSGHAPRHIWFVTAASCFAILLT